MFSYFAVFSQGGYLWGVLLIRICMLNIWIFKVKLLTLNKD